MTVRSFTIDVRDQLLVVGTLAVTAVEARQDAGVVGFYGVDQLGPPYGYGGFPRMPKVLNRRSGLVKT
jgi:hypothetical protein